MIPRPPCEVGRTIVSHLTLAFALVAFPLQIKFLTTPRTWQHILGFGFQEAARYHMEARSTWFATRILPTSERRQVLQLISLPLRADNILSKLASRGRWNPTWIPRYHPFAFWDPLESHFLAPLPFLVFFTGPDRSCFVQVYFCSRRFTEGVQDFLCPFHIIARSLQVERGVVRKSLVCYFPSSREGQTFYSEMVVIKHVPKNVRCQDEHIG